MVLEKKCGRFSPAFSLPNGPDDPPDGSEPEPDPPREEPDLREPLRSARACATGPPSHD